MWCDADALWDKLPGTVGGGSRLHFHQNADIIKGGRLDPTPNPTAGFWGKMTDSETATMQNRRSDFAPSKSSSQQTILQKLQSILKRKKEKEAIGISIISGY